MRITRLQEIVNYINRRGIVSFSELYKEFNISTATMRRDLKELDNKGLIEKMHGGAKAIDLRKQIISPYEQRKHVNIEEKIRVAKHALSIINENDIIIIDSSTTTAELAKLLVDTTMNLTVITNDVYVAYLLAMNQNIILIMVGGSIFSGTFTTTGVFSEFMWKQINANKMFMSIDAISPQQGILSHELDEVNSKRLMIDSSEDVTVLCDHTKFSTSAVLQLYPISKISRIITGSELSDEHIKRFDKYPDLIIRV